MTPALRRASAHIMRDNRAKEGLMNARTLQPQGREEDCSRVSEKNARETLLSVVRAGLDAVAPDTAVLRHMRLEGNTLRVFSAGEESRYDLAAFRRIVVLGAGKGAAPMSAAVEDLLGDRIADGLIVVKYGHGGRSLRVRQREAGHPVPDMPGVEATRELLEMARAAQASDLVVCVLTGGASALTPALMPGLSLSDVQALTTGLLGCGADIHEINTVRRHLSAFGGGNLARAVWPATLLALIVSDVVGDDLHAIASGPTVPDPASYADALRVLEARRMGDKVPAAVLRHLREGAAGAVPETPKPGDPIFGKVRNVLVATNRQALDAAAEEARRQGFIPRVLTSELRGEARERAGELAAAALKAQAELRPGDRPLCLLAGGETTVTLRGGGRGGRNQEMALTALIALEQSRGVHMVFVGTDGSDGPTDAAGGFAASGDLARLERAAPGMASAARRALDDNDSYAFLDRAGCLLRTGPTRTNVMDVAVALVFPPA